jgi:dTMP kinase
MAGLFVTVEGIDGSGKSTLAEGLVRSLKRKGVKVWLTSEPTDTWLGEAVRHSWESGADPTTEALLFIADRVEHCKLIRKRLEEGFVVISDRYHDSTLAYQGAALAQGNGDIGEALEWLTQATPAVVITPDLTLFLYIEPREAIHRIASRMRGGRTKFERLAFLTRVHKAYLLLGKGRRFKRLDALLPVEELVEAGLRAIMAMLD